MSVDVVVAYMKRLVKETGQTVVWDLRCRKSG